LTPHAIELPLPPAATLRALGSAAEEWGAAFEPHIGGGQLRLPVVAGLRRGLLSGTVSVEARGEGSRVVFSPELEDYRLQVSAVVVLLLAGAGALATVAWPLFPKLLPIAPFGAVLALCGWFLVISRLRGRGPAEFLAGIASRAEAGAGATPGELS
jgi:hypothetical protein